jgi:hypothetical protein
MDYEDRFYSGDPVESVRFEEKGFIYGPLRLSYPHHSMFYTRFVEPALRIIHDKIAIFLIRDPRDVLVSSYYSFGYTHGFSAVKEIEEQQREAQYFIQRKSVDTFALESATSTLNHFQLVEKAVQTCSRALVLKYEDMISNWDKFAAGLTTYLDLEKTVLRNIFEQSRPLAKEDPTSHRRSGRPGAYRDKLLPPTVAKLNLTLRPILKRFNYDR